MKKLLLFCAVVIPVSVAVPVYYRCETAPRPIDRRILGKWYRHVVPEDSLTFFTDGRVTLVVPSADVANEGSYSFGGPDKVNFVMPHEHPDDPYVYTSEVSFPGPRTMTLTGRYWSGEFKRKPWASPMRHSVWTKASASGHPVSGSNSPNPLK